MRVDHSLYARLGEQDAEEVYQVMGTVREVDNRTSLQCFVGTSSRGGEHLRRHGRLSGYESAIDAEGSFARDEDEVAVIAWAREYAIEDDREI